MENTLSIVEESVGDPLYTVADKKVIDKARLTLPEILRLGPSIEATRCAVYATRLLPYKTQFGPVDAPLVELASLVPGSFLLKSKVKVHCGEFSPSQPSYLYFNTSDEKVCNWMCLVRVACSFEEQNLIAHFVKDEVFFTTTKTIQADEELKVWYAPRYAQYMGERPLLPAPKQTNLFNDGKINDRPCPTQRSNALPGVSSLETDANLNERSIPPKKRGWNRTNPTLARTNDQNIALQSLAQEITNTSQINQNEQLKAREFSKQPRSRNPGSDSPQSESDPKQMLSCPECGKVFAKKYTLKMHRVIHSNKFDFLCHACGKGFKRKDKLHDHIKRVHLTTKPSPKLFSRTSRFVPRVHPKDCEKFLYKCLRCSLGFQRRGMLINHFTKKHPDVDVDTIPELMLPIYKDEISFSCLYCNKIYKSNHKRNCHILKHHPGRSLPQDIRKSKKLGEERSDISKKGSVVVGLCRCPHCPAQYSSKAKLVKHIELKHVENSTHRDLNRIGAIDTSQPSSVDFTGQIASSTETRHHVPSDVLKSTNQDKAFVPPNSIYYSNVDNSIQIWDNRECSTLGTMPDVMTYSKQGGASQDMHQVITMNNSVGFSNQISPSYFSMRPEIPLIDDSIAINSIEESNKIPGMLELNSNGTFPPSRADYVTHQPNMNYVAQISAPDIPDSSQTPKTVGMSGNCEKSHAVKRTNTTQRLNKPLPPTYSRGRKQFLLQFCGDSMINNNYEAPQQYSSSVSNKPPEGYNMEVNVVGGPSLNSNQNQADIQVSAYASTTSNTKDLSAVDITPLTYSDDINSWMFNT